MIGYGTIKFITNVESKKKEGFIMKEKNKKIIATSTIIFSLLLTSLSLSSCNDNTTTTTSIEKSNSNSISENKKENKTTTEETEFVFSTVETTATTVATAKPIEAILSEKDIDITLQTNYETSKDNPMIKSVYNLYALEDIYTLVPFFAENFKLREDGTVNPNLLSAISLRYDIVGVNIQSENLEPMVYLDMLYSVKSKYFPNKSIDELKEMGITFGTQPKEEVLYILQNY